MERVMISKEAKSCASFCKKCPFKSSLIFNEQLQLLPDTQSVRISGEAIKLSIRGFRVLCALLRCVGRPVSSLYLSEYAWPDGLVVKNNLPVTISELRTSLRYVDIDIINVRGFGYQLELLRKKSNMSYLKEEKCSL